MSEAIWPGTKLHMLDRKEFVTFQHTQYFYVEPKKWPWLAKLAMRVLDKLGALRTHFGTIEYVEYTERDAKELTEKALYQLGYEIEKTWGNSDDYAVVCGWREFDKLARHNPHVALMSSQLVHGHGGYRGYFRFPIHVVPWIDGFAIIPKVVIERKR